MEAVTEIQVSKHTRGLHEGLRWVLKARDKKGSKAVLMLVKVETKDDKKWIYCADGFRLHLVEINNDDTLPDGQYEVKKNTRSTVILGPTGQGTYPNIWHLIPDSPKIFDSLRLGSPSLALARIAIETGKCLNYEFLEDLLDNDDDGIDDCWDVYTDIHGPANPFVFRQYFKTAVIMPLCGIEKT